VGQSKHLDWYESHDNSRQFIPRKLAIALLADGLRAARRLLLWGRGVELANGQWLLRRFSIFSRKYLRFAGGLYWRTEKLSTLISNLRHLLARAQIGEAFTNRLFEGRVPASEPENALWGGEMGLCDGCSRPISCWNRRVWQDPTHQFHRACWEGQQFFRKFIASQCELDDPLKPEPGGYGVSSYEAARQNLIANWEFGSIYLVGGTPRAANGHFGYRAVPALISVRRH